MSERLWCKACGTVTSDGVCDCNRWGGDYCEPNFVNYADELQKIVTDQWQEIRRLRAERLKLDKRIHNQRHALRENWMIVEMRRNYMGSPASRKAYANLLKRHQALLAVSRS